MKQHSKNPFTALAVSPQSVSLEMQESAEKIELIIRRHIITNVQWFLIAVIFSIVPIIVYSEFGREVLLTQKYIDAVSVQGQVFFLIMWYIVIFLYMLQSTVIWFYNVLIATNQRIIDLDVSWPFHRKVTEAQLNQIQDVSFVQRGAFANIFNFGNIEVQTAGIKQDIESVRIPDPAFIHDKITDLVEAAEG